MAHSNDEIRGVLLQAGEERVLLPNATVAEVMARMPVVVSDHGGMRELAERFGNALGFQPNDPADLARVLRRFLDEPELWAQLAPKRPVRSVNDDVVGLIEHYRELVSTP